MATVKITNEVLGALLQGVIQIENSGKSLHAKVLYALVKNRKAIAPHLSTVSDVRKKIIEKHVDVDKKTNNFKEKDGKIVFREKGGEQKANMEYLDILRKEVEIELHQININDFDTSFDLQETVEVNGVKQPKFSNLYLVMDYMVTDKE